MPAYDTGRIVFNPPLLKQILTFEVTHSDLIPVALEWFSGNRAQARVDNGEALTGINEPDVVLLMSLLDRNDWRQIKAEILTDDVLAAWVSATVDSVNAWIVYTDLTPQTTWDLNAFKARLNTQHGVNVILIAYKKLQPCTTAEIQNFQSRLVAAPTDTQILYNLCRFPAPWEEDQIAAYKNALAQVVNAAPNQFALTQEVARSGDTTQGIGLEALKQELRLIRRLLTWAWLVPVVLLLLVLAMAVRTLGDLSFFWGLPLVVTALVSLLPALTYQAWIATLLGLGPLSETSPIIFTEASRSIIRLAAHIFQPLLIQALILLGLGIVLVVSMLVSKKKAQPSG